MRLPSSLIRLGLVFMVALSSGAAAEDQMLKVRDLPKVNPIGSPVSVGTSPPKTDAQILSFIRSTQAAAYSANCIESSVMHCNPEGTGLSEAYFWVNSPSLIKSRSIRRQIESYALAINFVTEASFARELQTVKSLCLDPSSHSVLGRAWAQEYLNRFQKVRKQNLAKTKAGIIAEQASSSVGECLHSIIQSAPRLGLKAKCMEGAQDLSAKFPPKRDQTDTQWCFAHAAADMLSFYEGVDVSASYAAILTHVNSGSSENSKTWKYGGSNRFIETLELLTSNGYCLEKDSPSEALRQTNLFPLGKIYEEIELFRRAANRYRAEACALTRQSYDRIGTALFPLLDFKAFQDVINNVELQDPTSQLIFKNCSLNLKKPSQPYSWTSRCFIEGNNIEKALDFLSSSLKAGAPSIAIVDFSSIEDGRPAVELNHEIVIVGMRWNEKSQSCEVRVRDSARPTIDWIPMERVTLGACFAGRAQ